MAKYTINTHHNGREWIATFDDYDGAPDSPNRSVMGKADNEVDAIMDLLTEDWAGMPKIPILGHEWKAHRQPSTPDSPEEWFYSCANCGVEKDDDNEYEHGRGILLQHVRGGSGYEAADSPVVLGNRRTE